MAGKYLLTTLGCKVNQYESQQIRELLESHGLTPAAATDTPTITVVNTCAVTCTALRKSRQALRRLSHGGRTPVVAVGCAASAEPTRLAALDGVTAVLGHDRDICREIERLIARTSRPGPAPSVGHTSDSAAPVRIGTETTRNEVWINPPASLPETREVSPAQQAGAGTPSPIIPILPGQDAHVKERYALTAQVRAFAGHQRAFLKVQDGCDAFCSYCVIPQLRTDLRSKPIETAVAEAEALVRAGHKEIVVTGIFLGAYGHETAIRKRQRRTGLPLTNLVEALAGVEGLRRLRLSSLEPGDVDDSLLEILATRDNCVPHMHLPLQSGSDEILRRMNRQYTCEDYLGMIERVRRALDRPAISTDIIVGFPGETESDFQRTLDVASHVGYVKIHIFPFSPREGTPAARARWEPVPREIVSERIERLAELERQSSLAFRRQFIGATECVLVERVQRSDTHNGPTETDTPICSGRTDRYFEVHFPSGRAAPGDLVPITIDRVTPTRTHGSAPCTAVQAAAHGLLPCTKMETES